MSDEKSQQQTSTESTVAGAAKAGKAISNIAKGAAAGGAHGAAIEAGKSSAKWLIPLIAAVLLPLILVAMLPSIIFGSLLGDGTDSPNGISNDEVLTSLLAACRLSSPMRTPESGSVVSSSRFAKSMVKFSGPIPPTATASSASPTQRVAGIPSLSARRKTDTHSIPRLSMHASRIARLRRLRSPTSAWPLS